MNQLLAALPEPDCRCADTPSPDSTPGSSDVAAGDLALLYGAVTARLRLLVGDDFRAAGAGRGEELSARICTGVLECVAALDQLHSTLARHPPLDAAAREAMAALLPARAGPVGSKAGSHGPDPTLNGPR